MLKESQIHRLGNEILDPLPEDYMATVVTLMQSIKNIFRVVGSTIVVTVDIAYFGSRRRIWWRKSRMFWVALD
jgi:hypothetical protein